MPHKGCRMPAMAAINGPGEGSLEITGTQSTYGAKILDLPGADPGFFLGGGAPLRNDVTDQ